jgi:hypothetical protein
MAGAKNPMMHNYVPEYTCSIQHPAWKATSGNETLVSFAIWKVYLFSRTSYFRGTHEWLLVLCTPIPIASALHGNVEWKYMWRWTKEIALKFSWKSIDHTQYKPAHKKPGTPKLCNLTITYQSIFYDVKCTYICNICDFFALPVCHIPRHGTHTWFWLVVSHSRDRLL